MNCDKRALTVAIAAMLGGAGTAANAAVIPVFLTAVTSYSNQIPSNAADLTSSTATWQYDDVTNLLTQTGGVFEPRFSIVPNVTTLFRHTITGLVIGNGANAVATSYLCINGNFGETITFANYCGNYNFGANFVEESTISYGPGTAFARTIGGDDMLTDNGIQQNIQNYDGFNTLSWDNTTLILSNATLCGNNCYLANPGYTWTLTTTIPIPPAAYLFASTIGPMGWLRRKVAT